jgi:chromosome segregation ATPase
MKFHPYSEIFPLIEGAALDELAADIKANGLREKIWLYEGEILDGRNRFIACQRAKIDPKYRKYTGNNPLAFVISLNVQRRHLTESQRAMAAARIATLQHGHHKSDASIEASSQTEAAESLSVGRSSVQRARKVIEGGSKALQRAVEQGDVTVSKAAAVIDLPKSEQLAAATAKPVKAAPPSVEDERWEPDADEDAAHEAMEKEYGASIAKVMDADDKLAAAHAEIKRQAAEIATLKLSRDGFMNGKSAITKLLKTEQRKVEKLNKQIEKLENEIESLRERVAIMDAA